MFDKPLPFFISVWYYKIQKRIYVLKMCSKEMGALNKMQFRPEDIVVLTVSGRGDKDTETYLNNKPEETKL